MQHRFNLIIVWLPQYVQAKLCLNIPMHWFLQQTAESLKKATSAQLFRVWTYQKGRNKSWGMRLNCLQEWRDNGLILTVTLVLNKKIKKFDFLVYFIIRQKWRNVLQFVSWILLTADKQGAVCFPFDNPPRLARRQYLHSYPSYVWIELIEKKSPLS